MNKAIIKDAKPDDALIMSKILAASWKKAYIGMVNQDYLDNIREDHWKLAFYDWLRENKAKGKIVYYENKPIGCGIYGKGRDKGFEHYGEIIALYLMPDFISKGFGKQLIDSIKSDLKIMGFNKCYLWVLRENKHAMEFYKKCGFEPNGDNLQCLVGKQKLIDYRYICKL